MKSSLIAVFLLALNVLVLAEQPYWMHYMGNDEPKKVLKEQQVIADLPDTWDWRDVDGVNYLSPLRSQHVPVHCGACWAHAVTSCLNDRFRISGGLQYFSVMLAPQQLVDCTVNGSCIIGYPGECHEYAYESGLVDETCDPYRAVKGSCKTECYDCFDWSSQCDAVPAEYVTRYYVSEFGYHTRVLSANMVEKMKTEIYNNGPIVVEIATPDTFMKWRSSAIFNVTEKFNEFDHAVSLFGWGHDDDLNVDYWLLRNSWGTNWGDPTAPGTCKVLMGSDVIGIESIFWYAIPDLERSGIRPDAE